MATLSHQTTHREETVLSFTAEEVIDALRKAGKLPYPSDTQRVTQEAYVRVPGGGDWSNTDLTLDDTPLMVKVVTES